LLAFSSSFIDWSSSFKVSNSSFVDWSSSFVVSSSSIVDWSSSFVVSSSSFADCSSSYASSSRLWVSSSSSWSVRVRVTSLKTTVAPMRSDAGPNSGTTSMSSHTEPPGRGSSTSCTHTAWRSASAWSIDDRSSAGR
jgi:hypothetical protein